MSIEASAQSLPMHGFCGEGKRRKIIETMTKKDEKIRDS